MKLVSRIAFSILAFLLPAARTPAAAQEVVALNLTLRQTHTKTAMSYGDIGNTFMDAFTPTTVTCPKSGSCMVQIQLSVLTSIIPAYDEVIAAVKVDGQLANPNPNGTIVLRANTTADEDDNHMVSAFTWVQVVAPGKHVVTVQLRANQVKANLRERTEVVSVYN